MGFIKFVVLNLIVITSGCASTNAEALVRRDERNRQEIARLRRQLRAQQRAQHAARLRWALGDAPPPATQRQTAPPPPAPPPIMRRPAFAAPGVPPGYVRVPGPLYTRGGSPLDPPPQGWPDLYRSRRFQVHVHTESYAVSMTVDGTVVQILHGATRFPSMLRVGQRGTGPMMLVPGLEPTNDELYGLALGTAVRLRFTCYVSDTVGGWEPRRTWTVTEQVPSDLGFQVNDRMCGSR